MGLVMVPLLSSILAVLLPNMFILYKLCTRPIIRTIFSISLGSMLAIFSVFGPILVTFHFTIIFEERNDFSCARFMEVRTVVLESLKIVFFDVLFRFFFIVHAEKGLLVGITFYLPVFMCFSGRWAAQHLTLQEDLRVGEHVLYSGRPAHLAGLGDVL